MFLENQTVDERISRAIDNDHTAAMKAPIDSHKLMKKKNVNYGNPPDMVTVCMLCKKAFKNALVYRKHMRLHSEKALMCHICGKSFGKKHYLQAHLQTHGKNQYQCHLCHKRFSQKGNLNQHLKFHNTKKAFKCTICGKDFYQQEHLKTHLRHHNNERPFECELCHKSFNIKSSLQRHMNCHTGEKPFICDICNRGYTRRSVLMLHIQQVHENKKPFECDECHLCFSQKGNLQAHYRRKHLQPKSEGKRGKDGSKGKRSMKRQHSRSNSKAIKISKTYNHDSSSDDQSCSKTNKPRMDNTSLHSYACKVKAIVSRGAKAQAQAYAVNDIQFIKSPSKSVVRNECEITEQNGQSSSYSEKLNLVSFDTSSSCSLSDDTAEDAGCSSSSSEDIPEINFPNFFENDVKPLADFDTLLTDTKVWDEFILGDSDNMFPSTLPQYDISEVFMSPVKSNIVLTKSCADITEELFNNATWNDDYSNPLFTADDLDGIKDLSTAFGNSLCQSLDIKKEIPDQEKRFYTNSKNNLNISVQKVNLNESSVQA